MKSYSWEIAIQDRAVGVSSHTRELLVQGGIVHTGEVRGAAAEGLSVAQEFVFTCAACSASHRSLSRYRRDRATGPEPEARRYTNRRITH